MVRQDYLEGKAGISAALALFFVFVLIGMFAPPMTTPADGQVSVAYCGDIGSGAETLHTYNGSFQTNADVTAIEVNYSKSLVNSVESEDISGTLNGSDVSVSSFKKNTSERTVTVTLSNSLAVNHTDNFTVRVDDVIQPKNPADAEIRVTFRNSTGDVETKLFATSYGEPNTTVHRPVTAELGTYTTTETKTTVFGFTVPNSERTVPVIQDSYVQVNTSDTRPVIQFQIQNSDARDAIQSKASGESDKEWLSGIIAEVDGEHVPVYLGEPSEYASENLDSYVVVNSDGNTSYVYHEGERAGSQADLNVRMELDSGYMDRFAAYGWDMIWRDVTGSAASIITVTTQVL